MKKLFIPLLITMTGLAVNSALAQSSDVTVTKPKTNSDFVTVVKDGQTFSGKELDATTRNKYLTDICSATGSGESYTISSTKPSIGSDETGVYLVEVNDYWIGMQGTWSVYNQLNKGVSKISAVKSDSKQITSSGTFYTHPATNVNKFFFIKLRSKLRRDDTPFGWYDEWSYVTDTDVNGSAGWDALEPTWDTLMDGTPFPSPHNCNSSLENNHYIALDGEIPTDRLGHDFTAYLYIPSKCDSGNEPSVTYETIRYGNISSKPKTYYIYNSGGGVLNSTSELTYVFTDTSGSVSFATAYEGKYYSTISIPFTSPTKVQGYEYEKTKKVVKEGECPYVFFYAVGLNEVTDEALDQNKKVNYDKNQNPYNVPLQWTTAFDKFANHGVQKYAKYDGGNDATKGIREHYLIERSYDQDKWEIVSDDIIVSGNDVIYASNKTTVDKGLKPFDAVTEEIGYTVWYRVTSYVEKSNGTRMSTTTSNVIRVDIPGKVPFKLTLEGEGTMTYDPVAQTNKFTNTIISAESKVTDKITLVNGSKLGLYRVQTNGTKVEQVELLKEASVSEVGENNDLQELAKLIDNVTKEGDLKGKYNHSVTLPAGDENVAAYQLMMTMPTTGGEVYKYSNILTITNPAISNTTVAVHRSGTPDAATCAEKETFHNEIKFKASAKQIGTGYYIYRNKNATPIMKLNYTESGFRVDGTDTYYVPDADGYIYVVDIIEDAPIAVGETGSATNNGTGAWYYAVAHYDKKGNTYGSQAKATPYTGARDELLLSVEANMKAANFSQPGNYNIYTVVTITWSNRLAIADTEPSKFEIYVKKKGEDRAVESTVEQPATAPIDLATDPIFEWEDEVDANTYSYTFTDTYLSKWQSENKKKYGIDTTKEELAKSLEGAYEIYVKMTTTEGKEKNSFIAIPVPNAGAIYTGIEGVEAQEMDVKVVNGVVEVNGVYGMIKVIDAKGAVAAEAVGTGDVTEIEGLGTGVYVVTAKDMKPTKILIK